MDAKAVVALAECPQFFQVAEVKYQQSEEGVFFTIVWQKCWGH
jgi:hypothetical protein